MFSVLPVLFACGSDVVDDVSDSFVPSSETVSDSHLDRAVPVMRNADHQTAGPLLTVDRVWSPDNAWDDVDVATGLTFEEGYRVWIDGLDAMDSMPAASGTVDTTGVLVTPWGDSLPLPRLECAETALFLRATYAAWNDLPFFTTAYSPSLGQNVYYGHFGMVKADGSSVSWAPTFSNWTDHSDTYDGVNWPSDAYLADRSLTALQDDHNGFLGPDAFTGAYLDRIHLNKRVGHLLMHLLVDFGSMHLAYSENTFDVVPEAVDAGDILIHRWQPTGVGHAIILKSVEGIATTQIETLSGNMPRVQPRWYNGPISRSYLTHHFGGGEGESLSGVPYSELGGGVKRWRQAEVHQGRWMLVVPDTDVFIDPDDHDLLAERPAIFEDLLADATPEAQRDGLLEVIQVARDTLAGHPSSCANRERRERAFEDLYAHMDTAFGWTRERTDSEYRTLDDYVYAELTYADSPSCCWNSTNGAMHDVIIDHAEQELADAEAAGSCVEATVFTMVDGAYTPFSDHAATLGVPWVEWSADEACPQADQTDDIVTQEPFTPWCELEEPGDDEEEPEDPQDPATPTPPGSSDCGCESSSWSGLAAGGFLLAGIVVPRRRRQCDVSTQSIRA